VVIAGQKKVLQANVDSSPKSIARRFINEQGVEKKYQSTLSILIKDQINKIKEATSATS
jgi:hypothetical protein